MKQDKPFSAMTAYELIDLLNEDYPHQCIGPAESKSSAHRYAGKRDLIDQLMQIRDLEREEASVSQDTA